MSAYELTKSRTNTMKNWKESLRLPSTTIKDARRVINESSMHVVIVVDEQNKLLGMVTESDLRKAILKHIQFDDRVTKIMNATPKAGLVTDSKDKVALFFKETNLMHLPIVNNNGVLVSVEYFDEHLKISKQDNWVIIMAGGMGNRLKPLTENTPKAMLKVGTKPILERIIISCIDFGFNKFYLSVNYRSEMIENYFGDGSTWGIKIVYLREKKRMGTAGALSLLPEKPSKPFLVINGDLLTELNFQDLINFHLEHKAFATMCIREYEFSVPFGVVKIKKNEIERIDEKPVHKVFVNAGIYMLEPDVLQLVPDNTFLDMTDLLRWIVEKNEIAAVFPVREYWLDIGRIDDYKRANGDVENLKKR